MAGKNFEKKTSRSFKRSGVSCNTNIIISLSLLMITLAFSAAYALEDSINKETDEALNKKIERIKEINEERSGSIISDESMGGRENDNGNIYLSNIIVRIVFYLLLILLIIFAFLWMIRYIGGSRAQKGDGSSIDLIDILNLGQNRSIFLVRVMESVYVLAQTQQRVTLLDKIEGEKAMELIASGTGGTSMMQFKDMFNTFLGKFKRDEETGG